MILITFKGGLGNQLFQYASMRALSLHTGNPLAIDVSSYTKTIGTDTPREYSLSHFNIVARIATEKETRDIKYPFGIISEIMHLCHLKILRRFHVGFDPLFWKMMNHTNKGKNIFVDGYFQTERYFIDQEATIRKELTLKNPLSAPAQTIADLIRSHYPSVSLHVRRGDVARDAATNPYYGIATPEYYAKALAYLSEKVQNLHVFVFSDDIEWVKQNIPISLPITYVSGNGSGNTIPDHEELVLMSTCSHNIIANSSFSWWGAWLNSNPNKIVIAPKEWIKRKKRQHKDICPRSWIRL